MKIRIKKSWMFGFLFLIVLSIGQIMQSSFLFSLLGYNITPYLTLPIWIYFFLHYNYFLCLCLIFFLSFCSLTFSSLSLTLLFFVYFVCFLIVLLVKKFFFFTSSRLFFASVFIVSLCFPYFMDVMVKFPYVFLHREYILVYFLKACLTLVLAVLFFPLLKKVLETNRHTLL